MSELASQPGRGQRWASALVVAMIALGLIGGLATPSADASDWSPPQTVWVESARQTVDGLFLEAWRGNQSFFGMPISEEFTANVPISSTKSKKLTVQYFENLAIAYSPNDKRGADWTVHALPLGSAAYQVDKATILKKQRLASSGSCGKVAAANCRRFAETGHTVRWGFKDYWELNGGEPMLGLPISEEFVGLDGWTTQYFERAVLLWKKNKDVKPRAIGRETVARKDLNVKKVNQPDGIPVYDEALFQPPVIEEATGGYDPGFGPGPQQGTYKEIVVSISQQTMWAYENGELVTASLVSTGTGNVPETVTPIGYYSVLVKYDVQTMEGTISDEYYNVPDVPYVMYFDNLGNALHGTYWHSNFGSPMSHGCVNLPMDIAAFLYGWAPEGTAVSVIG